MIAALDLNKKISLFADTFVSSNKLELAAYFYDGSVDYEISSSGHLTFLVKFKDGTENTVILFEHYRMALIKACVNECDFVFQLQRLNSIYHATYRGSALKCILIRSELVHLFELMPKKKKEKFKGAEMSHARIVSLIVSFSWR